MYVTGGFAGFPGQPTATEAERMAYWVGQGQAARVAQYQTLFGRAFPSTDNAFWSVVLERPVPLAEGRTIDAAWAAALADARRAVPEYTVAVSGSGVIEEPSETDEIASQVAVASSVVGRPAIMDVLNWQGTQPVLYGPEVEPLPPSFAPRVSPAVLNPMILIDPDDIGRMDTEASPASRASSPFAFSPSGGIPWGAIALGVGALVLLRGGIR